MDCEKIMKTNFMLGFMAVVAALFLALALTGCSTPSILSPAKPEIPAQPAQPAITNAATGAISPALPAVAAVPAVPAVVTNLPNATVEKIVQEGNAVAPLVPEPYGAALTGLLALLGFGATTIAAIKNKQLASANAVSTAIIQGVESAGTAASAVKTAIAATAKANGVADAVELAVNNLTGHQ